MTYGWLLLVSLSVNVLIWACVKPRIDESRAEAFRAGLVMGRALDTRMLDRVMREAGIDPTTLPGRP